MSAISDMLDKLEAKMNKLDDGSRQSVEWRVSLEVELPRRKYHSVVQTMRSLCPDCTVDVDAVRLSFFRAYLVLAIKASSESALDSAMARITTYLETL